METVLFLAVSLPIYLAIMFTFVTGCGWLFGDLPTCFKTLDGLGAILGFILLIPIHSGVTWLGRKVVRLWRAR